MNPRLALTTTLAIALLFVLSSTALAQNSNCAYTFTYTKNAFSFCISQYGTLGMLQAPIGVNLIDPNAPIEGYVYYFDIEGNDNFFGGCQVPNLPNPGNCLPQTATCSEPNGPGTLPLIAKDGIATTTITANPSQREVMILTELDIGAIKGANMLTVEREAVFQPSGTATFSSTGFGPYAVSNYGVRVTTNTAGACFGNYSGVPPAWSTSNLADPCRTTTFSGPGSMLAEKASVSPRYASLQIQYAVF